MSGTSPDRSYRFGPFPAMKEGKCPMPDCPRYGEIKPPQMIVRLEHPHEGEKYAHLICVLEV